MNSNGMLLGVYFLNMFDKSSLSYLRVVFEYNSILDCDEIDLE